MIAPMFGMIMLDGNVPNSGPDTPLRPRGALRGVA
jgi:hypothetical protein